MEKTIVKKEVRRHYPVLVWGFHALLGSLFLVGCSQIEIPLSPVPITLQTLGVFLLALFQGSRKACLSCVLYLIQATLGMPVLSGATCNPLWIVGTCGGFLLAFPIAGFVIGKLVEKRKRLSFGYLIVCVAIGQIIIYLLGLTWLTVQLSFRMALVYGLLPFLWIAGLKCLCAASLKAGVVRWQRD